MDEFDKKLNQYYEKLNQKQDLLENIMKNSKNQDSLDVLLLPNNENELLVAEAVFDMMDEILTIVREALDGELKEVDVNNCDITNAFVDIINAIRNNDNNRLREIKEKLLNNCTIKGSASLVYNMIVVLVQNHEEFVNTLANRTGFSLDDEYSVSLFNKCMGEANRIMNSGNNLQLDNLENLNDEKVNNIVDFTSEFHRIHEENYLGYRLKL